MLKLFNKEHVAIGALTNLKDYKIEYLLSGEDLAEFSLSITDENIHLAEEEGYVQNKFNEYVIKAIDPSKSYKRFSCMVNVESIKGKSIANFDTSNNTITDTIRLAIAGTGWILSDNNITKRRTVRLKNTNALEVLREVRKVFRVDFRFDAINKIIYVYEKFGSDKGVYFTDELNLIDLKVPSETHNYTTRLYPYGKDGLNIVDINNGKEYIENFQYSNKVIELIWEDNRYTIIDHLKEDAVAKLEELSKPKRTYQADIADLAKYSEEYNFLDFFLGDTITLISKSEKFRDKQRIIKYIEYPNDPSQNTCELGNTTLTFEDFQQENEYKNKVVDNITTDNGTIDGSTVDGIHTDQIYDFKSQVIQTVDFSAINAKITNLEATNVTITGELNSVKANIGTLTSNIAIIDKLTVTHSASINDLQSNKASITQLDAVNATISVLEANVGKIETLVNGNLSSENIQAGGITSDKLTIANGFIKNAMIDSLDVSKVNAGDISTNKFRIKSDDGGIEIVGATQQFKDKNNKVRIQMGKDAKGDFNFIIRGEDGTTTLIDHNGVKQKAIADDLIISNMIASDSVGEKQINYSSFTNGFNKDANTSTLKATKIKLDNQNQSLEVAFNSLKTQADGTKTVTENNSTTINVMQGKITTAINNTQIVKDGQTVLLKDDYNRTVNTVNSMNSTIGSHTTQINNANGKITNVETRVNTVERDLNNITARVSSTESTTTSLNSQMNKLISPHGMPYTKDLIIYGDSNKYYPVYIIGGNQDILRTIKIWRNFSEQAPSDWNTATHKGSLMLTWQGNFGGWGGADYKEFILENSSQYTQLLADCYISVHCMGYTFFLRGGGTTGAIYHFASDQAIDPKVYYNGASDLVWSNSNPTYNVYAFAPVTSVNTDRLNALKIAKESSVNKVSNKVSEIEVNLSSITSRVSNVESKQTNTDGKITSIETWKKEAEQKITDSSIVSIVSKQFYSKGEVDGKYATKTSVEQTIDKWKVAFKDTANNGILNSNWNKSITGWFRNGYPELNCIESYTWIKHDKNTLWMRNLTNMPTGLFQTIKTIPGKVYTFIFKYQVDGGSSTDSGTVRFGIENLSVLNRSAIVDGWHTETVTFTATQESHNIIIYLMHCGIYAEYCQLIDGNGEVIPPWTPSANEILNSSTEITQEGILVKNGAIRIRNQSDYDVFWVDSSGNLCTDNIYIYGAEKDANLEIGGVGNKGIGIRSSTGGERYIDFCTTPKGSSWDQNVDSGNLTRLYAKDGNFWIMPTSNLHIQNCRAGRGDWRLQEVTVHANESWFAGNVTSGGTVIAQDALRCRNIAHPEGGAGYVINVHCKLNLMDGTTFRSGVFAAVPKSVMFLRTLSEKPLDILDSIEFINKSKAPRFNSFIALPNQEDEVKEENTELLMDVSNIIGTPYATIDESGNVVASYEELLKLALKEIKELKCEIKQLQER